MMETVKLDIGSVIVVNGRRQRNLRTVEFIGERLAERTRYGYSDRTGQLSDLRGVTETLYRTSDGRLVVYIEDWSRWQNEPTTYTLREVSKADLVDGEFAALGREAGLARSLTLDEALS